MRRDGEFSNTYALEGLRDHIGRGKAESFTGQRWEIKSRPYGVAYGVPGRVDRLKQLGNAVVPQIPELIGRAIMDVNHE